MKKFALTGIALGFAAALSAGTALADLTVATVGPISGQLAALGVSDIATALPWPAGAEMPRDNPPIADLLFGVTADGNANAPVGR